MNRSDEIAAVKRVIGLVETSVAHAATLHSDKPESAALMRRDIDHLRSVLATLEKLARREVKAGDSPSPQQPTQEALTDAEIRKIWREAGGGFRVSHVEHAYMEETKFLPFMRRFAAQRVTAATDKVRQELINVLKPFAEAAENLDDKTEDRSEIWELPAAMSITAGDLRRAARALTPQNPGDAAPESEE